MGEHGHYQKTTLFENATHVPLVIAGPGVTEGAVAKTMAEMVDFYPTLSELAGLPIPSAVSGLSLVPALKDPSVIVRDSALSQYETGYSLRTADYRFTQWGPDGKTGVELYDRTADPAEMKNVADQPKYADVRQLLTEQLERRIESANIDPPASRLVEHRHRRRLKAKK